MVFSEANLQVLIEALEFKINYPRAYFVDLSAEKQLLDNLKDEALKH